MEQALLKDNIFSTQVNTAQASDFKTRAKTHNFLLKKVKNNKMWAPHHRNFNKQLFHQGKSILPFEWTICVKYTVEPEIHFFQQGLWNVLDNKHLASDLQMRTKTQNFSLK